MTSINKKIIWFGICMNFYSDDRNKHMNFSVIRIFPFKNLNGSLFLNKWNETKHGIYLSNFFNLFDQWQSNPYYCWLRTEKLKKGLFSTYLYFLFACSSYNKQTNGNEKKLENVYKTSIDAMKFHPKRIEFPQISNKSYDVVVTIVLICCIL